MPDWAGQLTHILQAGRVLFTRQQTVSSEAAGVAAYCRRVTGLILHSFEQEKGLDH